jgi:peptide/nickel transport system substrate-binding protein
MMENDSGRSSFGELLAEERRWSRREVLRGALVGGAALSAPGVLAACSGDGGAGDDVTPTGKESVKRGGRLRVGVTGGGGGESLDPHKALSVADIARTENLYDRLTVQAPEGDTQMSLAESFEPNASADVWTVKLKPDITFHDGKPLTADDVIYSYRRILDPDEALQGAADIGMVDAGKMRKVDELTIEMTLKGAYADFPAACEQRSLAIIPAEFSDHTKPVGTGPFRFESFAVGERSLFQKHENYWEEGKPYVDELEILSIADPAARMNALNAGQVDAIESVDLAQAKGIPEGGEIRILNAKTGAWVPVTISVKAKPFDDPRVRQALRLIADRQQIVDQALLGFGFVGNDLFCPFDPMYADDLPQREQDIEQARSLLQQAGQENLIVELNSSQAAPGMLESALIYAEQAKEAGVTVEVKRTPADSYWNDVYLKVPVAQSQWAHRALDPQILQSVDCKAPYNETEWCRPEFDKLTAEARGTLDEARRRELYYEAQRMLYDEGGYLIWGFTNWVDAYRDNVNGLEPHVSRNLGDWRFENVSLS